MDAEVVQDSYDAIAELYASLFLGDLQDNPNALEWLARFAELAARQQGPVADLGCGPGHVTNHLSGLGLTVSGSDLSPGQVAQARQAFPALDFSVADFSALDDPDASLGGIVSRYSIIHTLPSRLPTIFQEWLRVLEPGAPLCVSFFGALSAAAHGESFDHKAVTAYALFPATIAEQLVDVGFTDVEASTIPIPKGGRPFDQATVLARKPTQ